MDRNLTRRDALAALGSAGLAAVLGACSNGGDPVATDTTIPSTGAAASGPSSTAASTAAATSRATTDASDAAATTEAADAPCETIPEETAGPFPGDGTNGPDILSEEGVVRSDITSSIGSASGVAEGVPLTVELTVLDASGCAPLEGVAVYLWHCDRDGGYSMYSPAVADQNYLRGVQAADAAGTVRFESIFPGCYDGRWPHIHFEVFDGVEAATGGGQPIATSQLAFPETNCDEVYATSGYSQSLNNLDRIALESDMVFRDGWEQELATVTGNPDDGYVASLTITV